jgi:glutamate carboxypeptidase
LIADRLRQLGGKVAVLPPSDVFKMDDTPAKTGAMVQAEWQGTGKKKVLLIAHMDTVYLRGMLKDQPFRVDGNRAYGLGIADDKQGVALILHIVAMLNKLGVKDYGTLTVLVNGDEEISSPGSRATITRVAPSGRCSRSRAAAATGAFAWRPAGSARRISPSKAARRTPARDPKAASTRSTSSRTRSCS